ncbi:hypothetical protein PU629_07425 [Pullulanibacillus sp. KACC 23026]|uniref:hypothetical protein n=1 Tax=Pullulanibacillus sp. KACC 23026 TaxID=3028315 RepID=UPI0023B110D7|nr:hypothetical protein [Pullulanibacillus sp. KACC 23026]WEG12846.1 hypothetical protein PU629_00380 [Pullulanibacillus sp. KACC 23026]WEG14188.1 hypothetical protein PU629_07425 [Pullulanibacillus sp. KACC 23026]
MLEKKLTIVPVTLHNECTAAAKSLALSSSPTCMIKTATTEITFHNGIEEHIIRTVMRELKNR